MYLSSFFPQISLKMWKSVNPKGSTKTTVGKIVHYLLFKEKQASDAQTKWFSWEIWTRMKLNTPAEPWVVSGFGIHFKRR